MPKSRSKITGHSWLVPIDAQSLFSSALLIPCALTSPQSMYLDRPVGLLALLDEESLFPKGTDLSLGPYIFQTDAWNHAG